MADQVSVSDLRQALPTIIDFLEVQILVYRTEKRDGNAIFAQKVVNLFKAFLNTPLMQIQSQQGNEISDAEIAGGNSSP